MFFTAGPQFLTCYEILATHHTACDCNPLHRWDIDMRLAYREDCSNSTITTVVLFYFLYEHCKCNKIWLDLDSLFSTKLPKYLGSIFFSSGKGYCQVAELPSSCTLCMSPVAKSVQFCCFLRTLFTIKLIATI